MINKDYKTQRRHRTSKTSKTQTILELLFFGACLNLVGVALASLVPQGMWVYLFALVVGVAGITGQIVRVLRIN